MKTYTRDGKSVTPRKYSPTGSPFRLACDSEGMELGSEIAHGDLPALGEKAGGAIGAVVGGAAGSLAGPQSVVKVATFPACHGASCNCSASGGKKKDCDGISIYDGGGNGVAAFGKGHGAVRGPDGSVHVYRVVSGTTTRTSDEAIDRTVELMRARLAAINQANSEFWAPREASATTQDSGPRTLVADKFFWQE